MKQFLLALVLIVAFVHPARAQVQNPNVNIRQVGGTTIGTSVPVTGTLTPAAGSVVNVGACSGATCYTTGVNSGITTITSGSTSTLFAATTDVQSIWCVNVTASDATITITDGNNAYYVGPTFTLTAKNNGFLLNSANGIIFAGGVRASAGTAGAINCQVAGKQ